MKQSSYVTKLALMKVGDGRYVCLPTGYTDLQLLAAIAVSEQETTDNYDGQKPLQPAAAAAADEKKRSRSKNVRRICGDNSPDSVLMLSSSSKRTKRKRSGTDDEEAAAAPAAKKQLMLIRYDVEDDHACK